MNDSFVIEITLKISVFQFLVNLRLFWTCTRFFTEHLTQRKYEDFNSCTKHFFESSTIVKLERKNTIITVALPVEERSHQCSGCWKFGSQLRRCSKCQSVRYCSVQCQKSHWPKHKVLCDAIKELSEKEHGAQKGLGDAQDENVYVSHITPRQQDRIANLVGRKCTVQCHLDDKPFEVLWDTGAQVSIMSEDFLKSYWPSPQEKNIRQLLGEDGNVDLQAVNGTDIPYCGWTEIGVQIPCDKREH